MFRQPLAAIDGMPKTKGVILCNEVIDIGDMKAMLLQHPDPAMRVMMVYAFIKRMAYEGVASFSVYDWQSP